MIPPKVVGIGGGHGLAASLRAALSYASEVSAVVTVADDGGSSGRLTRELNIPPPGDIRNCLVALAQDERMARLYQHRFSEGALTGHTIGNLMIAALTESLGDFGLAVQEAGRLIDARGRVFPATTELVELAASVPGGTVTGQVAVARSERPIQRVFLEPADPPAYAPAVEAISSANQILLGPGSLFTSLIATLLVPGIAEALRRSPALKVFIANNRVQKGETEDLTVSEHLNALEAHLGSGCVDAVVVQHPQLGGDGVPNDLDPWTSRPRVIAADVSTSDGLHDSARLGRVLQGLR